MGQIRRSTVKSLRAPNATVYLLILLFRNSACNFFYFKTIGTRLPSFAKCYSRFRSQVWNIGIIWC